MLNPNYTHAVLLVDRSGSMDTMRESAQASINKFMKDQAGGVGQITVSLYDFNAYEYSHNRLTSGINMSNLSYHYTPGVCYRRVFGPIDPVEAPAYELVPSGGTALRDAMSAIIDETGSWLASLPEALRPANVVFCVITDGEENSSVRCSQEVLKEKVKTQTEIYKWEFVFFGANIDAFDVGASYGITSNVQYANTGASYAGASNTFSETLLASRAGGASLTDRFYSISKVDEEGNVS